MLSFEILLHQYDIRRPLIQRQLKISNRSLRAPRSFIDIGTAPGPSGQTRLNIGVSLRSVRGFTIFENSECWVGFEKIGLSLHSRREVIARLTMQVSTGLFNIGVSLVSVRGFLVLENSECWIRLEIGWLSSKAIDPRTHGISELWIGFEMFTSLSGVRGFVALSNSKSGIGFKVLSALLPSRGVILGSSGSWIGSGVFTALSGVRGFAVFENTECRIRLEIGWLWGVRGLSARGENGECWVSFDWCGDGCSCDSYDD